MKSKAICCAKLGLLYCVEVFAAGKSGKSVLMVPYTYRGGDTKCQRLKHQKMCCDEENELQFCRLFCVHHAVVDTLAGHEQRLAYRRLHQTLASTYGLITSKVNCCLKERYLERCVITDVPCHRLLTENVILGKAFA